MLSFIALSPVPAQVSYSKLPVSSCRKEGGREKKMEGREGGVIFTLYVQCHHIGHSL